MFRIPLILAVFLALTCTAIAAAADNQTTPTVSQRADAGTSPTAPTSHRHPPHAPTTAPTAPHQARSTEPTVVTGRPDGRTLPDAVDARTANPPVVIRTNASDTTSFDWLAALIGALAVAGVALAVGGLLIVRHHSPTPAR